MAKPSTPSVWASGKSFGFQPSAAQQAQGFDYIASVRPSTGAPITDDHDWPLNNITTSLKWVMDQLPVGGIQELLTALLPKRTFSARDFIRIPDVPGGLIIQWGNDTTSGVGLSTPKSFPTPFPAACIIGVSGYDNVGVSGNPLPSIGFSILSKSQFALTSAPYVGSQPNAYWIAVGF